MIHLKCVEEHIMCSTPTYFLVCNYVIQELFSSLLVNIDEPKAQIHTLNK